MIKTIDLNGLWAISYDNVQNQPIQVPGVVESVLEDRNYSGPFEYTTSLTLDQIHSDSSYVLQFDGVSYYAEVYCNEQLMQKHEGIWDSFKVDITGAVHLGANEIKVKVIKPDFDKESPYFFRSVLFGFIPDIMLPFGGIWKDVKLLVRGKAYFEHVECQFDTDHECIHVASMLNEPEANAILRIKVSHVGELVADIETPYAAKVGVQIEDVKAWSPSNPNLYKVEIELLAGEVVIDSHTLTAGFRKIEMKNGEIVLNGEPFYMRGAIHWGCYPEKFTPAPSYEEVKDELIKIKSLGFNTIKHCLYFPPTYYYELCDEMGIVTWQELPLWLPYDNEQMLDRVYDQYPKMLKYFMHYPSVSLVSLGCELDATISTDTLNDLYQMVKDKDSSMIICDNSGSGENFGGVTNASSDIYDYHFYAELYNLGTMINEFTRSYRATKPWLFGEFNDSDTFRLVKDIKAQSEGEVWWVDPNEKVNLLRQVHKGFGSDLPIYYQDQILEKYGITEEVQGIKELSYKQMHSIRKYILETTRSYNEIKGYNITAINDVPITTSGILDYQMEHKFESEEMLKFNGDIVVSLNKDLTRIWDNGADRFLNKDLYNHFAGDTIKGRLTLSNRSPKALVGQYEVILKDQEQVHFAFTDDFTMPHSHVEQLAQLAIELPDVQQVTRCELVVKLTHQHGTYTNSWDVWVYPKALTQQTVYLLDYTGSFAGINQLFNVQRLASAQALNSLQAGDILITTAFDEAVEQAVEKGIHVIAVQKGEGYFPLTYNPFYREGVKVVREHPVTDMLGHIGYAGLQFYGVGTDRYFDKFELEKCTGSYKSLLRRYDARRFTAGDYLVEFAKGNGRVLLTTLNLDGGQGSQPYSFAHNNFAIWLMHAMITYLNQDK